VSPTRALNDEQLTRIRQLFDTALSLPSAEWNDFVRDSTDGDDLLQHELSSLLVAHAASDGFFEKLAGELVRPAVITAIEADRKEDADPSARIVSHYELVERVAGGAMGVVYKAHDTRLGRTVALKFLPRHHASNPSARERLVAEARAASRLDHPNIGIVYEIGEAEDGQQFIAMAWYDGESLRDSIRREALPISRAIDVAAQLCAALDAAHTAGIIHRDVKPANVMITSSGVVKLVDFGIAKLITEGDAERHSFAGTVAYMSPEQIRGMPLDPRTDIWSLGVVLYEMLAGRRPFRGNTEQELIASIENEEPPPIAAVRPDVSSGLAAVIDRCLTKDRDERYQSAQEIREALRNIEAGSPKLAPGVSAIWFSAVRDHRSWIVAGFLSVLIAAGIWKYSRDFSDSRSSPSPAAPVIVGVLPFTEPTGADSTRYLAEALSDDLREDLGRFPAVSVPSYLSSEPYAGASRPVTTIARELDARFVVTATVKYLASGARIDARLIDGQTGKPVWSRTYVMEKTRAVDVVRAITVDVLSSANVRLAKSEKDRNGTARTKSSRAYDLYLRGRYAELTGIPRTALGTVSVDNVRSAQAFYSQAKSLDPDFAVARERLAMTHAQSAVMYDTTEGRLEQTRIEAEFALRLDPQLSEPYEVLSTYWKLQKNPQKAIEALETGLKSNPNNVSLLLNLAQRYLEEGRWEDGLAQSDRAARLDPRNPTALWQAAVANGRLRRNADALKMWDRLIQVAPRDHEVKLIKGQSYLRWKGSTDVLFAELRSIPPDWDARGMATFARYTAYRTTRRYSDGLVMLSRAKTSLSRDGLVYHPKQLIAAELYYGLGDMHAARRLYDEARRLLVDSLAAHPPDGSIHAALGLAYAGLGRKRDAIREAERAIELGRGNNRAATAFRGLAVETFGRIGELDRAFQLIELLLTMPAGREITVPYLRVWPGFDPLRTDPRFNQLLDRFTVK
jgi:serine/threonine-protein kinase